MRILSVVSLVSPDGAYGGPLRVAANQAQALIEQGHRVTLAAGVRGYPTIPDTIQGVPAQLFPARTVVPGTGFAGLASPGLQRWVRKAARAYDVAHIHIARDLITLPAARALMQAKIPLFVQPHGMIDPSSNPLAIPLDAQLTRPVLRAAQAVFYLTKMERNHLRQVAGDLNLLPLANGVPFAEDRPAEPGSPEVLFLARLAPRKRPVTFVEAAELLGRRFPEAHFTVVGPDEGEGSAVSAAIDRARAAGVPVTWEGALAPEETLDRMRKASVYVLPSVDEPYGMTVVEALSVARPVVVTHSCGLADFVTEHDAGRVSDLSVAGLAEAIAALLQDPTEAVAMGRRGQQAVRTELSMAAIATELSARYSAAISS
jgi:glycosyltransferase involved in cell wall biosynthesis